MREIKLIIDEGTLSEIESMLMLRSMAHNGGTLMDLALIKIVLAIQKGNKEVTLIQRDDEKEKVN